MIACQPTRAVASAVLIAACLGSPAVADDTECGTVVTALDRELLRAQQAAGFYDPVEMPLGPTFVPITFHVVTRSDGTGALSDARLCQALEDANTAWAVVNIQFYIQEPIDYIASDAFYFDIDTDAEIDALLMTDPVANTINVYCTPNLANETTSLCGRGSFTTSSPQGVAMNFACTGTAGNPSTFPHELGHFFDLFHTHETAFGAECVDGSNCSTAGDLLCDTPADPSLSNRVDALCNYTGIVTDPCNDDPYAPDTSNLMSYAPKLCRDFFSPDQRTRAFATLVVLRPELINVTIPVADDCNGNGIGDFCETDCNDNGQPDDCDIAGGISQDCNTNGVPDECDLAMGTSEDCNTNGVPDECDIAMGTSEDCNTNGVPDECDIAMGTSEDCNDNGVPDECDIAMGTSEDCNTNGVPDECDIELNLYSVARNDALLRTIDPTDGSTLDSVVMTLPGETIDGATGLAAHPVTGTLWALLKLNGQSTRELATVDPETGAATAVGDTGDRFAGLAFTPDARLYGVTGDGASPPETLYRLSQVDATPTLVATLGAGDDGEAIATDPHTGLLYHASGIGPFNDPDGTIFESIDVDAWSIAPQIIDGAAYEEATALTYAGAGSFLLTDINSLLYEITHAGFVTAIGGMDHRSKGLAYNVPTSPDCNENGVPDECDIASGASEDCNLNDIPDECDTAPATDPAFSAARDYCQHAELAAPGFTYVDTTVGATPDGEPFCHPFFGIFDVWYKYVPSWNGIAFVSTFGPGVNALIAVHDGCPGTAANLIDCDRSHFGVAFDVVKGEEYWIRIAGNALTVGGFEFYVIGPPALLNENDANGNMVPDECECFTDVNGDGVVNMADFIAVTLMVGEFCGGCPEDVDGNGVVDEVDQFLVLISLGPCPFVAAFTGDMTGAGGPELPPGLARPKR